MIVQNYYYDGGRKKRLKINKIKSAIIKFEKNRDFHYWQTKFALTGIRIQPFLISSRIKKPNPNACVRSSLNPRGYKAITKISSFASANCNTQSSLNQKVSGMSGLQFNLTFLLHTGQLLSFMGTILHQQTVVENHHFLLKFQMQT